MMQLKRCKYMGISFVDNTLSLTFLKLLITKQWFAMYAWSLSVPK